MSYPTRSRAALSAGLLLAAALALAGPPIPDAEGPRVVDEAKALQAEEREQLAATIDQVQRQGNCRLRVLLIAKLDGTPIATYARQVANTWWAGRADAGRGVVLVLAIGDRRSRIEVGSDLEGKLTPARCQRILDDMAEPLRAKQAAAALTQAVQAVGTALAAPAAAAKPRSVTGPVGALWETRTAKPRSVTGPVGEFWEARNDREKFVILVVAMVLIILLLGLASRRSGGGYYCDRGGWHHHHHSSWGSSSRSSSGSNSRGSGGGFRGGGASGSW